MVQTGYAGNGKEVLILDNNTTDPVEAGDLVTVNSAGQAIKTANGDLLLGMAETVKDGKVTVKHRGIMTAPAADDDIEYGVTFLSVEGENAVAEAARGRMAAVIAQDTENGTVTFYLF